MRVRFMVLLLAGTASAFGGYSYDWTGVPSGGSTWTANGIVDYDYSSGIDFGNDSGSFIYQPGVSVETGGSANDYEVSMSFYSGTGTVIEFLRASPDAMRTRSSSTGSFISVELKASTLQINQCVSGSLTLLGSTTVSYGFSPPTLRSVIWGTTLWVFLNNNLVYTNTSMPSTTGQPGIGGIASLDYDAYNITGVSIGHHDTIAPSAPALTGFRSSVWPTSVSLAWQGVTDDSTGIGFYRYDVSRNGTPISYITGTGLLTDSTVAAATPYTYTVSAVDYHGNVSATTTINLTTPAASDVDPRRTGLYTTGSYWGGGGRANRYSERQSQLFDSAH